MLKKYGYPQSLATKRLPRCRVGKLYYMWKDHKACRFLGGKLVYMTHRTCKTGRPHQWQRVTRCVRGAVITNKGFNYKTGRGHKKVVKKPIKKVIGTNMGKCPALPKAGQFKSKTWNKSIRIKFINKSTKTVKLQWHDYKGKLRSYGYIKPGATHKQQTYATHPWSVAGSGRFLVDGAPVFVPTAKDNGETIIIKSCRQ
jgi:hypothetical protein